MTTLEGLFLIEYRLVDGNAEVLGTIRTSLHPLIFFIKIKNRRFIPRNFYSEEKLKY